MTTLVFPIEPSTDRTSDYVPWSNEDHQSDLLKFQIQIPSDMKLFKSDCQAPEPDAPVRDLAYFRDDLEKPSLEILVQASVMQHETALRDYYLRWAELGGDQIVHERNVDDNSDRPDMLTTRTFPDGATWVSRRTGYKTWMQFGAYVVTLDIGCDLSNYAMNAQLFHDVTSSLAPLTPPKYALAEDLTLRSKRYPVDFASYLPASWKELHHHNDTQDQMQLAFTKEYKGIPAGLRIRAARHNQFADKSAFLRDSVSPWLAQGLDPTQFTYQPGPMLDDLSTTEGVGQFTSHGEAGSVAYEYRFLLAEPGDCWFYVDLVGLAKQQDFECWAINQRALEIFVDQFKHSA